MYDHTGRSDHDRMVRYLELIGAPAQLVGDMICEAVGTVCAMVRRSITTGVDRYRYRVTVRKLSSLVDTQLDDIGVKRYEIHKIASQVVYGTDRHSR